MIKVKASDVKTGNVLDEELRWSTGREGQRRFEKSFMNRDEAREYCILMVEEHPHVGESLNGLAELYKNQGKYAEAEPLYKRSLAIREKALGPEHPKVATSLENYAALLRKTNGESEVATLEARAKAIRAKHAIENPTK